MFVRREEYDDFEKSCQHDLHRIFLSNIKLAKFSPGNHLNQACLTDDPRCIIKIGIGNLLFE